MSLFAAAFPLCALLALANNLLEVRVDAIKLCLFLRRPEATQAADIGSWETIMSYMCNVAVLTNAALVFFTSTSFSEFDMTQKLLFFFAAQHVLFIAKATLEFMIPDLPHVSAPPVVSQPVLPFCEPPVLLHDQ